MSDDLTNTAIEKGIETAAEVAKKFIDQISGPALTEAGGLIGDRVAFWRFKQRVTLALRTEEFLRQKGVTWTKTVPPSLTLRVLESGSLETDTELRDRWAALLANAADPASTSIVTRAFPLILENLSTDDVHVLELLYSQGFFEGSIESLTNPPGRVAGKWANRIVIQSGVSGLSRDRYLLTKNNLGRLGLCQVDSYRQDSVYERSVVPELTLTPLGVQFVMACRVPEEIDAKPAHHEPL